MTSTNAAQTYQGLIITRHHVVDSESKEKASYSLSGWENVGHTAPAWIRALENGHTIQPSLFKPQTDGTFTHTKEHWQSTHFVCADGDNFQGVERNTDGTEKNPDGIPFWTGIKVLGDKFPELKNEVYAVGQSVSSMQGETPHRRYRLIFVFDKPICSEAHYEQILSTLAKRYPIISPGKRSPAQPVFGNARKHFSKYHICEPENILQLDDFPFIKPIETERNKAQGALKLDAPTQTLDEYLNAHQIAYTQTPEQGKYFVDCPYKASHTGAKQGKTDSYVFDDGKWSFHCSHSSCQAGGRSTWQAFKDGHGIKTNGNGNTRTETAKPSDSDEPKPEKFNASDFGQSLMIDNRYWFTQEVIHRYNAGTGVYDECLPELRKECRQGIGRICTSHHISETLSYIQDMTYEGEQTPGVCLENGVFDFETMKLNAHSPDNYFLHSYPVGLDANAHCPDFDDWLRQVLPDEQSQQLIYEMIGSIFDPNSNDLQTAFLLSGSGSNGKSTLLDIIEVLVGAENISLTPFHEFGENRFAIAELVNKALALDDDVSTTKPLSSSIKPLITKKRHTCELKHINRFDFDMQATFIGAINGAVNTVDKTSAFWRRWCVIPFEQIFPKDANFKRDLMSLCTSAKALSGILNTALRAYQGVRERGEFSIPQTSKRLVNLMRMDSNHVRYFMEDCLMVDSEAKVPVIDVWESYKEWADSEQIDKKFSKPKCYQTIEELEGVSRKRLESPESRIQCGVFSV